MGVFTKTIDKLEKLKIKKEEKAVDLTEVVAKALDERFEVNAEVRKAEGYIKGIKSMMNIKEGE